MDGTRTVEVPEFRLICSCRAIVDTGYGRYGVELSCKLQFACQARASTRSSLGMMDGDSQTRSRSTRCRMEEAEKESERKLPGKGQGNRNKEQNETDISNACRRSFLCVES